MGSHQGDFVVRVVFYRSPGKFREEPLQRAVQAACELAGDEFVVELNSVEEPAPGAVAIMVGMKATALRQRCIAAGQRVIIADKGYDRKDDWWRVAIDAHQPSKYLMQLNRPKDRMKAAGWRFLPWHHENKRQFVLIAGGGAKYHSVWNLSPPAVWADETARAIRAAGWTGEIRYRPKPSQPDKTVPAGTVLSAPKYMVQALEHCHAIVTYGSNACFEAICSGVPSVITGDAVMAAVSSRSVNEVCAPYLATDAERMTALRNLAYCQFRETEFIAGTAWPELKRQMDEVKP